MRWKDEFGKWLPKLPNNDTKHMPEKVYKQSSSISSSSINDDVVSSNINQDLIDPDRTGDERTVRWTYQPGSHRRKVTQDFSSTFLRCVP
ncbi:unnamed protein product [Ascophyllum nodosum]